MVCVSLKKLLAIRFQPINIATNHDLSAVIRKSAFWSLYRNCCCAIHKIKEKLQSFYVFISFRSESHSRMLPTFVGNCSFVFAFHRTVAIIVVGCRCLRRCCLLLLLMLLYSAIFHRPHINVTRQRRKREKRDKKTTVHSLWTVIGFILLLRKWLGCSNFNFIGHVHRFSSSSN